MPCVFCEIVERTAVGGMMSGQTEHRGTEGGAQTRTRPDAQ